MVAENKLPSVSQLQKFVREKTPVEIICLDGKSSRFSGLLKWYDGETFHLKQDDGSEITILRSAVLGYRVKKAK